MKSPIRAVKRLISIFSIFRRFILVFFPLLCRNLHIISISNHRWWWFFFYHCLGRGPVLLTTISVAPFFFQGWLRRVPLILFEYNPGIFLQSCLWLLLLRSLCAVGFPLPGNGSLNILRFRLSTKKPAKWFFPSSSRLGNKFCKVQQALLACPWYLWNQLYAFRWKFVGLV